MKNLYKNGYGDEIIYIQSGHGLFMSNFGYLNFSEEIISLSLKELFGKAEIMEETRALIIESKYPLETPSRYRNTFGQLLEHSPFCERDIKTPKFKEQLVENSCTIDIKLKNGIQITHTNFIRLT